MTTQSTSFQVSVAYRLMSIYVPLLFLAGLSSVAERIILPPEVTASVDVIALITWLGQPALLLSGIIAALLIGWLPTALKFTRVRSEQGVLVAALLICIGHVLAFLVFSVRHTLNAS